MAWINEDEILRSLRSLRMTSEERPSLIVILSPSLLVILSEAKNLVLSLRVNSAKNLVFRFRINPRNKMNELIKKAKEAMASSYSPYSHFKVGAAVLTKSGKIYAGCNIENCSYGLTICAERVAIFNAVSAGEKEFDAIAVVTDSTELTLPCGACRQVIWEFSKDVVILLANLEGKQKTMKISDLLPTPFDKDYLK